ncbi:MAG: TIGR00153 family protein [Deltaproteobacteria bacterium]|nr:TIGR00153 family protein [Deltaproteobacteria bacterium]
MLFKKIISPGKKEQKVLDNLLKHIKLLCSACETFQKAVNSKLMRVVIDLERDGDIVKRQIISDVYDGAFLPYLRPDLCRFTIIIDEVFDLVEDAAFSYIDLKIDESLIDDCIRVARLNCRMSEMLLISLEAMIKGGDLREKALAIRIYEKKVDDIKFDLLKKLRTVKVNSFWEGKDLSDFISSLTSISDIIEDAGDHLQVINVSLR